MDGCRSRIVSHPALRIGVRSLGMTLMAVFLLVFSVDTVLMIQAYGTPHHYLQLMQRA